MEIDFKNTRSKLKDIENNEEYLIIQKKQEKLYHLYH
jgi:hypothetical protein